MNTYDTVVDAINGLKEKGYDLDFNVAFNQIECKANGVCLDPSDFDIDETYRFDGETNPSDEDVVYAISSTDKKYRGILTAAYGVYADRLSEQMIRKLSSHHNI